jgi:parallel beta-helix repeat protein
VNKKPFLSVFFTAILIGGLVLVGTMRFGIVQAATEVSGLISSDTTWTQAGSPYTLTGNLLVENGVKLTINAGTTVNLGSYYIMVNGTLAARGTIDNPITFNGGSITFTSSIKPWNEQTQLGCIIENAKLTTTVTSDNAVKISSSTINGALTLTSDSIVASNIINGNVNGGKVSGNTITGDVNSADVFSNTITGNVGCSGTASNNYIKGRVGTNGDCHITDNTIIGDKTSSTGDTGAAIFVSTAYIGASGYPKIENNIIANSHIGISVSVLIRSWFSINIPEIRNNLIIQNGVGIQYSISRQEPYETNQTIIESNTIAKNDIGIKFVGTAQECQIINNNIQENINYSIYLHQTTDNINVTSNWWGITDQSAIANSFYDYYKDFNLGKVNFVPFLTAPNPDAPLISSFVEPSQSPSPSPPTPSPETTSTPTPTQEPQQTEQEIIIGVGITVLVIVAGLGLLIYLIKRK